MAPSNVADGKDGGGIRQDKLQDPQFLQEIRLQMLKFANLQIGDSHLAEDAVQEALMGAMKNVASFGGRSAFKTWVFAILKYKIADILRKRGRMAEVSVSDLSDSDNTEDDLSVLFDEKGFWNPQDRPIDLGEPERLFEQEQFWLVFETCLNKLPGHQAKVFMMREYIGLDTNEICEEVELSVSNLHVLLHRARLRLQKCLELSWLEGGAHA